MHHYDTSTPYGNEYVIYLCRKCGMDKEFCMCWEWFMDNLEKITHLKLKLEIYKCLKIMTKGIKVVHLVRRTPSSISGMRGLALLKREDKR
jgi:hypothetical protein